MVVVSGISIHALREEGDGAVFLLVCPALISIHALREEGDGGIITGQQGEVVFLSTPSVRRAT